ncbi:MAG: nucleotide exchange factor GrpE, partial [Haloplanus sp.]
MLDGTETDRLPTGIDLGSATTVGAVWDGVDTRLLESEEESAVPTRLAVSDAGFAIGTEASEAAENTVTPRRFVGEDEDIPAENLPLSVFLRELFESWQNREASTETERAETDPESDDGEAKSSAEPTEGDEDDAESDAAASAPEVDTGESDPYSSPSLGVTTVTVPGPSSAADMERVEAAAAAAGFEDVRAVRDPVAVAATELPDSTEAKTIGVVDIGVSWAAFALVTATADGTLEVAARSSLTDHGRETVDDAMTRWVLNEVGKERAATFEFDEDAQASVRDVVHTALDEVGRGDTDEASIEFELSEGVDIADGDWFGDDTFAAALDIDVHDCYEALADELREFQSAVAELFEATEYSSDSVDELLVAGDGTRPVPVVHAIENAFERRSRLPTHGDRYTAAAAGTAILSAERAAGSSPIAAETYDKAVTIRALDESGLTDRALTSIRSGPTRPSQRRLTITDDTQLSGTFEIGYRHRITGERVRSDTFVCSNLSTEAATPLTVSFRHDDARLDPDADLRTAVDVEHSEGADGDDPLHVSVSDDGAAPWLAHIDADTDAVAPIRPDERREGQFVDARSAAERAVDGIDDESVIESAHVIRNRLWERAIKGEAGMDRDELQLLLKEFDQKLTGYGAEIIDPDVGSPVDGNRHRVLETRPDERDQGTILEVDRPGLAIDDVVVDAATVAVADETQPQDEQSADGEARPKDEHSADGEA